MTGSRDEKEKVYSTRPSLQKAPPLFTAKAVTAVGSLTAAYLLLSYFLVGFKTDQLLLAALFNALYFASRSSRRFITGFSIFIVYWIVFDYMKAFPNYRYNAVHIQDLYNAEKNLFGFHWNNITVTPNEFFAQNHSTFLDWLAGAAYLCWVPVPLAFAAVLFFTNRNLFFQFSLTFFLVNVIGFIGYYVYPAAPPWYVAQYGFDFVAATPGNTAGLGRFDALVGAGIFKGIYAKSSNVFAAMPSLHASYMLVTLFYGLKAKLKGWNVLFGIIMCGIWFAAVYSGHHYVLDVLAGIGCAVVGIALFRLWAGSKNGRSALQKLVSLCSPVNGGNAVV